MQRRNIFVYMYTKMALLYTYIASYLQNFDGSLHDSAAY